MIVCFTPNYFFKAILRALAHDETLYVCDGFVDEHVCCADAS